VICAFSFRQGTGVELDQPDLASQDGDWSWTHLRLGDSRAQALIRGMQDLPVEARELFLALTTRVQIEQADGWIYGALPDFERDLAGKTEGEGRLLFALDARRLITARLHPIRTTDELRRMVERRGRIGSPVEAVAELVELYIDLVERALEALGGHIASVEDHVLTEPANPRQSSLSATRRAVARQRRELQALRGALFHAHAGRHHRRVDLPGDRVADLLAWLDDADREAGALEERGRLLHEEIDTLINAATNRSMRTLTVISTLLIPPTLIVGAFGMNLPGMPFEHSSLGFTAASAMCVAVVVGTLWLLRRVGMLS